MIWWFKSWNGTLPIFNWTKTHPIQSGRIETHRIRVILLSLNLFNSSPKNIPYLLFIIVQLQPLFTWHLPSIFLKRFTFKREIAQMKIVHMKKAIYMKSSTHVRMAEWSKAPDSSSGLRERAWVQIPLLTFS